MACQGTTKAGKACKAAPLKGGDYCLAHADEETRESTGFGGSQPGAGRPRLARPLEVLRERIEADIDRWLQPYEDALDAEEVVIVGRGEDAFAERIPDYDLRLKAAGAALDRVYGKPRQAVEHSGPEGGPVEHSEVPLDPESRELIGALLRRRANASQE